MKNPGRFAVYPLTATVFSLLLLATNGQGAEHGVVLMYHHISSTTPPSTSVSARRFKAHLDYLSSENFNVMRLSDMVSALKARQPIPLKSVAITFDDAYQSVYDTAAPELQARQMPFTVFVNTSKTRKDNQLYLDWQELGEILAAGGEIQNHGHQHDHFAYPNTNESLADWQQRVTAEVTTANELIEARLGITATLFAYPYGEYSAALSRIIGELGFIGFGQHSGAIGFESDFLALPRHPFYEGADQMSRFIERVNTRPLYINAYPAGPMQVQKTSRVSLDLSNIKLPLNCFFDGAQIAVESVSNDMIRTRPLGPFPKRRTKLNCTKPDGLGAYYWWSYLFLHQ